MDVSQIRELLAEVQAGARITTAIGEPVTVGDRTIIPAAEVSYGGGGGGGGGKAPDEGEAEGSGGGGGGGVHVRPVGCWVVSPEGEKWLPAIDANRLIVVAGSIVMMLLVTIKTLARHH